MPNYSVTNFFEFKRCTPSSLEQDNLLQFSYHSPDGVNDKAPLVFIVEKQQDRCYGFNVHYDSKELIDIIENTSKKVNKYLQDMWYRQYPEKKKQLKESRQLFDKSLIEPKDLAKYKKSLMKRDLEQFLLKKKNVQTLRCYLYKRMNTVSKCIWKI